MIKYKSSVSRVLVLAMMAQLSEDMWKCYSGQPKERLQQKQQIICQNNRAFIKLMSCSRQKHAGVMNDSPSIKIHSISKVGGRKFSGPSLHFISNPPLLSTLSFARLPTCPLKNEKLHPNLRWFFKGCTRVILLVSCLKLISVSKWAWLFGAGQTN